MMNDYPEARRYYMDRAWDRRIEFRRRQKKFLIDFHEKIDRKFRKYDDGSYYSSEDSPEGLQECASIESGYESNEDIILDSEEEERKLLQTKLKKISNHSIFFYEIDIEDELAHDFDDEELEALSEDEINFNTDHLLEDNQNAISNTHSNILNY